MTTTQGTQDEGPLRINVVVPVYNKRSLLIQSLGSVLAASESHGAVDVYLVDNGSFDGSFELIAAKFSHRATILRAPNLTIGAVRNLGAAQGCAPIISFLDCDCDIPLDYFGNLEDVLNEVPSAAIVGCKISLPPNPTWVERTWNDMHDDLSSGDKGYINSANLAIRRKVFIDLGGFSESLQTSEDAELCQRARQSGQRVYQDRRLAVVHLDNAKSLAAFYRKERWRGLGMLGTVSRHAIDKPVAMTALHLIGILVVVLLLSGKGASSFVAWGTAVLLVSFAPALTVAYRQRQSAHHLNVFQAFILYQLYYLARIHAFATIMWRRWVRGTRRAIPTPSETGRE